MMQSSPRRVGRQHCRCWANRSAQQVAHSTSMTAKTRRGRCQYRWSTSCIPSAGRATRPMLQTRTVGPYLQKITSFIRAGWSSVVEHDLSTEEERRTLPFFQETARPEKREWFAACFFSVDGGDWCWPVFRGGQPFTPEDATRLATAGPYLAKIVTLAQRFSAFDLTSKLSALERVKFCRCRHRRNGSRQANERTWARSTGRRLQPRPGSSGGARSRKQSPTAAAGFVCFACGARQRSGLRANRPRSG